MSGQVAGLECESALDGIRLEIAIAPGARAAPPETAEVIARSLAAAAQATGAQGTLGILVEDDAGIRALNRQWRGIDAIVWDIQQPVLRAAIWGLFAVGWLLVPAVSFMINHFDLFGTRQVWLYLRGQEYRPLCLEYRRFHSAKGCIGVNERLHDGMVPWGRAKEPVVPFGGRGPEAVPAASLSRGTSWPFG